MASESSSKTIIVALVLCLVCSIAVASTAVGLNPKITKNKILDKQKNILEAAGLYKKGQKANIEELFKRVEPKVVELATGLYVDKIGNETIDPAKFDDKKASEDPALSEAISGKQDIASIKRKAKYRVVYLVKGNDNQVESVILPIHGYGLWSVLYGYIALETDMNTVKGLTYYSHEETPGLGGEVDNPVWKALWKGKKVYDKNDILKLKLIKGKVDPKNEEQKLYNIDGLSGATLTSNGVTNMIQYWLSDTGFKKYITSTRIAMKSKENTKGDSK